MPTPPLDPRIRELIQEYSKQGLSVRRIMKAMKDEHKIKVGMGTVHNHLKLPVLREQSKGIRSDKKQGITNWREWVPGMKRMQELKKQSSHSQDRAFIELGDGKRPVALASFSDQHLGSWGTDYDALTAFTDELLATPDLYIGLTGDIGQYAIKLRSVLEVSDNLLPPEQQTEFIESWFNEIWHKVAFATWDNHGIMRQENQAGESSLKKTLSKKVVYFNGIGNVDIKCGDQIYRGAVSHVFRGRSIENPVHGQMRYMRREGIDREWAMAGDSHVPGLAKYVDGEKVRVAVNSGSLQVNSGFGKRFFSLTTHPVYPIIVFDPKQHLMTPFWSVAEWLATKASRAA